MSSVISYHPSRRTTWLTDVSACVDVAHADRGFRERQVKTWRSPWARHARPSLLPHPSKKKATSTRRNICQPSVRRDGCMKSRWTYGYQRAVARDYSDDGVRWKQRTGPRTGSSCSSELRNPASLMTLPRFLELSDDSRLRDRRLRKRYRRPPDPISRVCHRRRYDLGKIVVHQDVVARWLK